MNCRFQTYLFYELFKYRIHLRNIFQHSDKKIINKYICTARATSLHNITAQPEIYCP